MFNKKLIWKEIEKEGLDNEIKCKELMKLHTSWKIGGIADFFCIPKSEEILKKILSFALEHEIPVYIIGNGSNILVPDEGLRGLVVKVSGTLDKIEYSDKMIKVGAGILLSSLVRSIIKKQLSGIEFATHIPGTLGGAIKNNASFGYASMADIVKKIEIFNYGTGKSYEIGEEGYTFVYRGIKLGIKNFVITSAYLNLVEKDKGYIISKIKEFYNIRKKKQPIEQLSAGCVFKNHKLNPAGYLIEKAGAKGLTVGDAQVSMKHANFIINRGNATAGDILKLIEEVEKRVENYFGIKLEREINIIG